MKGPQHENSQRQGVDSWLIGADWVWREIEVIVRPVDTGLLLWVMRMFLQVNVIWEYTPNH